MTEDGCKVDLRLWRRIREVLDKLPFPEDVAVAVDVDPYQLL